MLASGAVGPLDLATALCCLGTGTDGIDTRAAEGPIALPGAYQINCKIPDSRLPSTQGKCCSVFEEHGNLGT